MPTSDRVIVDDGIAVWFDGPEWDEVARQAFEDAATQVADTARSNAIWEDQTGDARAGIEAQASIDNGDVVLTLYHTVDYGLWLEVIQNGRFGIIMKTLEEQSPRILQDTADKVAAARQGRD